MFFTSILRTIFFAFDRLIYGIIPDVYNLIVEASVFEFIQQKEILKFGQNIYVLLAMFMLFKLAFSLIQTIVNPDLLTDQNQGFANIIQRSMVALGLIVLIPLIFSYALRFQNAIINEKTNVFMKLFYGTAKTDTSAGQAMAEATLSAFLKCSKSAPASCEAALANRLAKIKDLSVMQEVLNNKEEDGEYTYDYLWLFSLVAGGFVLVMLLIFSIDIAVRTVKLSFLQMIAPIAVVSYIDPKSSESGFFAKWQKLCLNTYLLLFFRMAAIAFMVYAFSLFEGIFSKTKDQNFFLMILIIIGLLFFVKEVPKIIGDLFGIEDVGFGEAGKFLKGAAGLATGVALGGAAVIGGGLAGGITGGIEGGKKNILQGAWSGMKSGAGGVFKAKGNILEQGKAAFASPFKTVGDVGKSIKGEGYRWGLGRVADKWQASAKKGQYLHQQDQDERATNEIWAKIAQAESDSANMSEMEQSLAKIDAEKDAYQTDNFKNAFVNHHTLKDQLKYATNDFNVIEKKYNAGDKSVSEAKYREELIKFKKLESSAKTAEETFNAVKGIHKDEAEMYDLIRARESAEKVTSAAEAARTSASSSSTGSSGQQSQLVDRHGNPISSK